MGGDTSPGCLRRTTGSERVMASQKCAARTGGAVGAPSFSEYGGEISRPCSRAAKRLVVVQKSQL